MKRTIPAVLTSLTLAVAAAAVAQPQSGGGARPGASTTTISAFDFDLSALGAPPPAQLPAQPLHQQSLSPAGLTGALLQTQEQFAVTEVIGLREFYESPNWYLEVSSDNGSVQALRKPQNIVPQQQNPNLLRADSLQRLGALGIGSEEILDVLQRRLMAQEETDGQLSTPTTHRHKTFVLRGINGVEIEGHRAVVTHHRDGSLQRVYLNWPALAASGHRLHTDVSQQFIVGQTYRKLRNMGETGGTVRLRWKYVPQLLPSGEVQLVLMVGARLVGPSQGALGAEPREVDVKVFAY